MMPEFLEILISKQAVTANENYFFFNNEFIIGNKAYPVQSYCLAPYINRGNLTEVWSIADNKMTLF